MIAYEDLVVALSSWRAGQGLPANTVHFTSAASGSVDLALPIAEPIETLGTNEVEALDEEFGVEADYESPVDRSNTEDEDQYAASSHEEVSEESVEADEELLVSNTLDYSDDDSEQTAIASDFDTSSPFGEDVDASMADDRDEIAVDEMVVDEMDAAPEEAQVDPQTEEVDVLSEEFASDADGQEGPTQFGDMERESTSMGIGIDELQGPGPDKESEE